MTEDHRGLPLVLLGAVWAGIWVCALAASLSLRATLFSLIAIVPGLVAVRNGLLTPAPDAQGGP